MGNQVISTGIFKSLIGRNSDEKIRVLFYQWLLSVVAVQRVIEDDAEGDVDVEGEAFAIHG
jgi:hypothetical protein